MFCTKKLKTGTRNFTFAKFRTIHVIDSPSCFVQRSLRQGQRTSPFLPNLGHSVWWIAYWHSLEGKCALISLMNDLRFPVHLLVMQTIYEFVELSKSTVVFVCRVGVMKTSHSSCTEITLPKRWLWPSLWTAHLTMFVAVLWNRYRSFWGTEIKRSGCPNTSSSSKPKISFIRDVWLFFLCCTSAQVIISLQGAETGLRDHGELIKVKVVPYASLWRSTADSKALAAIAIYEMASREGILPQTPNAPELSNL